jgi:hypothetical protein
MLNGLIALSLGGLSLHQPLLPPQKNGWQDPFRLAFSLETPGNPYDFELNDIRVEFRVKGKEKLEDRAAYWDGKKWNAVILAKGEIDPKSLRVIRNGSPIKGVKVQLEPMMKARKNPRSFIVKGGKWGFTDEQGKPFWPIGFNLGWQSPNLPDLTQTIKEMGNAGLNWTRIWTNHWDQKNPWWPLDRKVEPGFLDQTNLSRWADLVDACEANGVRFQWVLFHHGQWTTQTNPNWDENPWNTKNGGFLADPKDFFTNPKAKKFAKIWLRYAVARWGHSDSIMAWELFNEVEWVNAIVEKREETVGAWHKEMMKFVRDQDPYDHLVTTSSGMELPIYESADYYQPHGYPPSVAAMIFSQPKTTDKPIFYGEVGPGDLMAPGSPQVAAIRDGIWSGLLNLHAGAGQYWTWDLVYRDKLFPEFAFASRILGEIKPFDSVWKRREIRITDQLGSNLAFIPGKGWAPNDGYDFVLPADADRSGELSKYFQGKNNASMRTKPVTFQFTAPKGGSKIVVKFSEVATNGGDLELTGAGKRVKAHFDSSERFKQSNIRQLEIEVPEGKQTLVMDNPGTDWIALSSIEFSGIAPAASGQAIVSGNQLVARVKAQSLTDWTFPVTPSRTAHKVEIYDLDAKKATRTTIQSRNGRLTIPKPAAKDAIVWIR